MLGTIHPETVDSGSKSLWVEFTDGTIASPTAILIVASEKGPMVELYYDHQKPTLVVPMSEIRFWNQV